MLTRMLYCQADNLPVGIQFNLTTLTYISSIDEFPVRKPYEERIRAPKIFVSISFAALVFNVFHLKRQLLNLIQRKLQRHLQVLVRKRLLVVLRQFTRLDAAIATRTVNTVAA